MADQDIEARAREACGCVLCRAPDIKEMIGEWDAFEYPYCASERIAQAIQEERDRCAEIVHVKLLRSYDEIKEGTRTQGGTKP